MLGKVMCEMRKIVVVLGLGDGWDLLRGGSDKD